MKRNEALRHTLALSAAFLAPSIALAQAELHQVYPGGGDEFDWFGCSVAISGERMIIGSERIEVGDQLRAGSAYLFDAGTGTQIHEFAVSDPAYMGYLGCSVGISGDRAVVGAYGAEAAYIFDVNTGAQLLELTASDGAAYDDFGFSVAISGDRAVVGAHGNSEVADAAGAAYVFDVNTGQELFKLLAADGQAGDELGRAVAIDGERAVIGAWRGDSAVVNSGSAYVFDVATGEQLLKLVASDAETGDEFGEAVSIHGNHAVIAACNDRVQGVRTGSAYLFDVGTGQQTAMLVASDGEYGDAFGYSATIGERFVVIGAKEDDDMGQDAGAAYVFDVATGQQLSKLLASNGWQRDRLGEAVAIDQDRIVLGVPDKYSVQQFNRGTAYVFCPETTGTNFCVSSTNSTGLAATLGVCGSPSLSVNSFRLIAEGVPNTPFLFFHGDTQIQVPFGNGTRCVGGNVRRLGPPGTATGRTAARLVDLPSTALTPGAYHFQCWFRDSAGGGAQFDLSDGISVTFVP